MSQGLAAYLSRITDSIERLITLLDEIPVLSADQVFLKTFLHNATGYLQKDIAPDTEALENWDSPENQRMLRRYVRHLSTEIRMVAEDLNKDARQDEARQRLSQRMTALLNSLEAEQGGMERLFRTPHRPGSHEEH
jgi:hypothetical protein